MKNSVYTADVKSYSDFYPFGMKMPGRYGAESTEGYEYGFNGMRMDNEMYNQEGNSYTTEFRQYDARIGRWLSTDPLASTSPWHSPYQSMGNNPVLMVDPNGDKEWIPNEDGTYTAEAGDGSWNLWNDHLKAKNYTLGEVESLLAEQGHEKYYRDGHSRTAIDAGDKISLNTNSSISLPNIEGIYTETIADPPTSEQTNNSNITLSLLGFGAAITAKYAPDIKATYSLMKMRSTVFYPKLYPSGWGGGSAGAIKTYKIPGAVKIIGKATGPVLGLINYQNINEQRDNGELNNYQYAAEHTTNAVSTFGGVVGAAWELGRGVTNTESYKQFKAYLWGYEYRPPLNDTPVDNSGRFDLNYRRNNGLD